LRASGEHVRQRSDPDTLVLTPQELRVVLLGARGATTNEEAGELFFLWSKSIEKHLGSWYGRLGLCSRAELARFFAAMGLAAAVVAALA
jgi:DNA-binding NarL/FixJ family response regulator